MTLNLTVSNDEKMVVQRSISNEEEDFQPLRFLYGVRFVQESRHGNSNNDCFHFQSYIPCFISLFLVDSVLHSFCMQMSAEEIQTLFFRVNGYEKEL